MIKYYYNRENFMANINSFFKPVNVLVDIGSGVRPEANIQTNVHICIEPYKEYIDTIKGYCPTDSHYIFINADALIAMKNFANESVDTVCMIDLIEHLDKEDGLNLLKEANRIAREQIIVFTPLGYFPQGYHEGEKDAWGLDGAKFQEHKSGWIPEDFGDDWDFHICEKYHLKEACHLPIDKDYGCLYAIKNKKFDFFEEPVNIPDFVKNCASPNRILHTKSFTSTTLNLKINKNYIDDRLNSVDDRLNSVKYVLNTIEQIIIRIEERNKTNFLKRFIKRIKRKIKEAGAV